MTTEVAMRIWRSKLVILLVATLFVPVDATASSTIPPNVQSAFVRALERKDLILSPAADQQFVRYDALGKLEAFQCPSSASFIVRSPDARVGGKFTIGECPKEAQLNEKMAQEQVKRFDAAVSAAGGYKDTGLENRRRAMGAEVMKPQVIVDGETVFLHLTQMFVSGIGGAGGHGANGLETMIMIPSRSNTVILLQGELVVACSPQSSSPPCSDARTTMREIARQLHATLSSPIPPQASKPPFDTIRPGRRTICDDIAMAVVEVLERSGAKQTPVTEDIRYKQSSQPEIQAFIRDAAHEHAQGVDISTAARNVGEECYRRWFKK